MWLIADCDVIICEVVCFSWDLFRADQDKDVFIARDPSRDFFNINPVHCEMCDFAASTLPTATQSLPIIYYLDIKRASPSRGHSRKCVSYRLVNARHVNPVCTKCP